jgi:hypothetical protein
MLRDEFRIASDRRERRQLITARVFKSEALAVSVFEEPGAKYGRVGELGNLTKEFA